MRSSWSGWGEGQETESDETASALADPRFGVLFVFYQRDPVYALGLAALSAAAKQAFPDLRCHLLPLFPHDTVADTVRTALALRPGLIAVSAMWPTWLPAVPHLRALKAALPAVPIVVGG